MYIIFCLFSRKKATVEESIGRLRAERPDWFIGSRGDEVKKHDGFYVYKLDITCRSAGDITEYIFPVRALSETTGVQYVYLYYGEDYCINSDIYNVFFETRYYLERKTDNGNCRYFGSGLRQFKERLPEILKDEGIENVSDSYLDISTMEGLGNYLYSFGFKLGFFKDGYSYDESEYQEWLKQPDGDNDDSDSEAFYTEDEIKHACQQMNDIVDYLAGRGLVDREQSLRLREDIMGLMDIAEEV